MKKIALFFMFVILFFVAAGSSYLYFSVSSKPLPVKPISKIEKVTSQKVKLEDVPNNIVSNVKEPVNKEIKDIPLSGKEVFLTFDDGPSVNTLKILKILDDENIKASFFVIGHNADDNPQLVRSEYKDGMAVLNHSYTHEYSMYKSIDTFMLDYNKCNNSIKNIIGTEPLHYLRFPGGSDNQVSNSKVMKSIRNEVGNKGIEYVDWNVDSGDADSYRVPVGTIDNNLIKQLSASNFAVVLMHDAPVKTTTVDALSVIIRFLKKQGFIFRTFADLTPTEEKEMKKRSIINRGIN